MLERTCMVLSIKQKLADTATFPVLLTMKYLVLCTMSVTVLQSTWLLLSTLVLVDGPGYLMTQNSRSEYTKSLYTCVDVAFKSVGNHNGLLFYFVEGRCGSLPCPPYDENAELSCSVCTKWKWFTVTANSQIVLLLAVSSFSFICSYLTVQCIRTSTL